MRELTKIQAELHAPKGKQTQGGRFNYKYRSTEDILEAVKPYLLATECSITLYDDLVEVGGNVYLKAIASIVNKDGECVSATGFAKEPDVLGTMSAPQITGSISSYARKYALCGLLAIDGTDDSHDVETQANIIMGKRTAAELPDDDKEMMIAKAVAEIMAVKNRQELIAVLTTYKDNDMVKKDKRVMAARNEMNKKTKAA